MIKLTGTVLATYGAQTWEFLRQMTWIDMGSSVVNRHSVPRLDKHHQVEKGSPPKASRTIDKKQKQGRTQKKQKLGPPGTVHNNLGPLGYLLTQEKL